MKDKKTAAVAVILIYFLISALLLCMPAASAETTAPIETYAVESFVETTAEPTETVTEPAETAVSTAAATDPSESTTAATPLTTAAQHTYRESLPEVASSDIRIPDAIGATKQNNEPSLFWGFVAWICIGVGSAVILAVLLTTKTKAYRSGGKKRYSTGDKISGRKRLLSDEYYNSSNRR